MRSDVGAPPINPDQVYDAGDLDRLNAILRFLFAAVRIGESTARPFRLDFDRVSIERNELHA